MAQILVVEDDDALRRIITLALARREHSVAEADSVATAMEVLAAAVHPIDVIILDLNLPDMNGTAILEKIKADVRLHAEPCTPTRFHLSQSDGPLAGMTLWVSQGVTRPAVTTDARGEAPALVPQRKKFYVYLLSREWVLQSGDAGEWVEGIVSVKTGGRLVASDNEFAGSEPKSNSSRSK